MQGVTITKKPLSSDSEPTNNTIVIIMVVAVGLALLPFFLLISLCFWLKEVLLRITAVSSAAGGWHEANTGLPHLTLRYQFIDAVAVSAAAAAYFDMQSLICYQANPPISFFEGYFTDFKVERADGVFVQKVYFNPALDSVLAMPLYFFSYKTQQVEELIDLKDYILDTKGNPEDFLLVASGEEEEVHIRLVGNPAFIATRMT